MDGPAPARLDARHPRPDALSGGVRDRLTPTMAQPAWKRAGRDALMALSDTEIARLDALAGRLFEAGVQAYDRLGLYEAMGDGKPQTAVGLSTRAGIAPRYAREWLEHQAVGGFVEVDDVTADPEA